MQFLKALLALPLLAAAAPSKSWEDASCLTDADAAYFVQQSEVCELLAFPRRDD